MFGLEKMVKTVWVCSLAAFVGVVVLGIGCNALDVDFKARARPLAMSFAGAQQILAAITLLMNDINLEQLYYGGASFGTVVDVDDKQAVVRLFFYNARHSLSGFCSMNPIWSQVLRGRPLYNAFDDMYGAISAAVNYGLYGHVLGVAESFGIEYFILEPKGLESSGGNIGVEYLIHERKEIASSSSSSFATNDTMFKLEEQRNVSFHLDDDPPCWVYSTCLINGENAALGSYLPGGGTLGSGNRVYKLIMQKDCNLVLYDVSGEAYVVKWASDTQDRGSGCYVNLQMDGNLVIVESGGKDALWASNRYCQPQPNCIITAALVVQDDGNLVVYNTDKREAIWSIF